jgi:3-hydroxyacyl-CoA dehydrogenase
MTCHPERRLLDFVGIETTYYMGEILFNGGRERRFAPPPLTTYLAMAGMCGRKAGKDFYDYTDPRYAQPNNFLVKWRVMRDGIEEFGDSKHAELLSAYREMANDRERETEAQEWCEGLISDGVNQER